VSEWPNRRDPPTRILFTFAGGSGHFEPLVPLARAAAKDGHVIAFTGRPWMVPRVEELGFQAFSAGSDDGLTPVRRPLLVIDRERELEDLRDGFVRRIARERAADLLGLVARWQPDVIVWEETDFGAAVIAERLDVRHAKLLVSAAGSFVRADQLREELDAVRIEYGLGPDPHAEMLGRYLVLSPFPPSLRDPRFPLPSTAWGLRLFAPTPAAKSARPPWAAGFDGRPIVYFTLGTVFNVESGDLFTRVIAGLRDLPLNVLVTVGRDIDPGELGPQPANVHVERHVSQASVLPYADLVVSDGGSGSLVGALAHGLPMVLIPMGADQPWNAERAATIGVARVLNAVSATPVEVAEAVSRVLANPGYRHAAGRLRDEMAALRGPKTAISMLERLVATRQPILADTHLPQ
jgi:UDP:flavonoid glycosyltransferase YjiC (YdhE family)